MTRVRDDRVRDDRVRDDNGSVLILGIGLMTVCLLGFVLMVDATAAFVQRQRLVAVADGAALAGAQAIDLPAYYAEGAGAITELDVSAVPGRVRQHLRRTSAATSVPGLRIERIRTDGRSVEVRLSAPMVLPFLSELAPGPVIAESRARLAYRMGTSDAGP